MASHFLSLEFPKLCLKGHFFYYQGTEVQIDLGNATCYTPMMIHDAHQHIKDSEKFCSKNQTSKTHSLSLTHDLQLNHYAPWNAVPPYSEDKNPTHPPRLGLKNT